MPAIVMTIDVINTHNEYARHPNFHLQHQQSYLQSGTHEADDLKPVLSIGSDHSAAGSRHRPSTPPTVVTV